MLGHRAVSAGLETARMLASLLGSDEEEATAKLQKTVLVTAAPSRESWAADIEAMAARTITVTRDASVTSDLELVVGPIEPVSRAQVLWADIGAGRVRAGFQAPKPTEGEPAPLFAAATAPIIAAMAIRATVNDQRLPATAEPLDLHEKEFGIPKLTNDERIPLDGFVMVGAGAVAHGFLRALRHVPVTGSIEIVDPKEVGVGNLNRCLYLQPGDEGGGKANLLATRAAPDFPNVRLTPHKIEFAEYAAGLPPVPTMIVTVDSRAARRKLQKYVPGRVLDASTTDARFVVVHSHRQPAAGACMSCLYHHTPDEHAREKSIAEALGLDIETIRTGFVTLEVAEMIVQRYPGYDPCALVNRAFDSLFRELCSTQALTTPEGRQVLTPFAFVSAMAGALLAIELVRQHVGCPDTGGWQVDPWRGPVGRTRRSVSKRLDCEFCSDPDFAGAVEHFWEKERDLEPLHNADLKNRFDPRSRYHE